MANIVAKLAPRVNVTALAGRVPMPAVIESVDGIAARHEIVDDVRITSAMLAETVHNGDDRARRVRPRRPR